MPVFMIAIFYSLMRIPHKEARFMLPVTYSLQICWAFAVYKVGTFIPIKVRGMLLKLFIFVNVFKDLISMITDQNTFNLGDEELYTLMAKNHEMLLDYGSFKKPYVESVYIH